MDIETVIGLKELLVVDIVPFVDTMKPAEMS